MKRFRRKRRSSTEDAHRTNEAVSLDDANRVFAETLRKYDYFNSWRKSGPKRFKDAQSGFVRTIDLIYADKWSRLVGLCATLEVRIAIKSDITASFFCTNAKRDGDELIYSFELKPGRGLALAASIDDAWRIAEDGLDKFTESLARSLSSEVAPWLERCKNAESLLEWMNAETPGPTRWPLMLTLGKTAAVRRELREVIGSVPEHRLREIEIDWYAETGVLSDAEAKELRIANMQIEEVYIQRMRALAIGMDVSG